MDGTRGGVFSSASFFLCAIVFFLLPMPEEEPADESKVGGVACSGTDVLSPQLHLAHGDGRRGIHSAIDAQRSEDPHAAIARPGQEKNETSRRRTTCLWAAMEDRKRLLCFEIRLMSHDVA